MRDEKEKGVLFVYDTVNVFLQFEVFIARSVSERNAAISILDSPLSFT